MSDSDLRSYGKPCFMNKKQPLFYSRWVYLNAYQFYILNIINFSLALIVGVVNCNSQLVSIDMAIYWQSVKLEY